MHRLKKVYFIAFLLFSQSASALNIIFALDELLLTVDQATLNAILGHENISTKIGFWWHGGYTTKTALVKDVMETLKTIPAQQPLMPEHQGYYAGQKMAPILSEWILGFRRAAEIRATIINHLHNHPSLDSWIKNKLIHMAQIGLDPEKLITVMHTVPEGVALLKRCYNTRRHNLYILSNCPAEIFTLLEIKFSEVFSLFSGKAISSTIHLIKPHLPIYHYLLNTYNLSPSECVYIGTTPDGLKTAQQLGMQTILWNPYDYAPGIATLSGMGILD